MWLFLKILLSCVLTLALGIKLAEICYHIVVALRGLDAVVAQKQKVLSIIYGFFGGRASAATSSNPATASATDVWPITAFLRNLRFPGSRTLQNFLFRYRTLMLAEIAVAVFSTQPFIVISSLIALFAGTWIEIFRILIDRLVFGHKDDHFRGGLGTVLSPTNTWYKELQRLERQMRLRNFIRLFTQLVALTTVSYAAMYCALDTMLGDAGAFANVPHTAEKSLHLLYFSIVTIVTVGYGDITPRLDCLPARLLTGSEILAGFAMLVLLVTCVSLTFSEEGGDETDKAQ